ncbi:MAG: L-seryl-tRNA(Sec) selenium transferase [Vicinamibacterales bacterium]
MPSFRAIPSIDDLRQRPGVQALEAAFGATAVVQALRDAAAGVRAMLAGGGDPGAAPAVADGIEATARAALEGRFRGSLRPVINATGVVIHTNLGRAPLAEPAIARLVEVARGYSNLEYDLVRGARGSRTVHAEPLVTALTGAEAAVVVNNNAAATMLVLAGLAAGREVIISRGELVEIGGGFRVPDVLRQSGARLREVGTTNRTRVADFSAAIGPATALILRVHPSNFRVEGFTEQPSIAETVEAGRARGVPVAYDIGSGLLAGDLAGEPDVRRAIAAGAALVCFSGDKLLGGPQAGIVAGQAALVDQLRRHPLMRALRVDKLTLAALEATLAEHLAGRATTTVPVPHMLGLAAGAVASRAAALRDALAGPDWDVALVPGASAVGGGAAPGVDIPTTLVALTHAALSAADVEARLRGGDPAIVARIQDERVVLDLRTVAERQDAAVTAALLALR